MSRERTLGLLLHSTAWTSPLPRVQGEQLMPEFTPGIGACTKESAMLFAWTSMHCCTFV